LILSKRARCKVEVVPRDYEVLKLLLESKVASRDQIAKYVFGDRSINTVNIRLKKLDRAKLIRGFSLTRKPKSQSAYSLTKLGLSVLKPNLPYGFTGATISSECVSHDTDLIDIRKKLESQSSVNRTLSENVLNSCQEYSENLELRPFVAANCDGVVDIEIEDSRVFLGLEYERSRQSSLRYEKKIRQYYSSLVGGVLYVCQNQSVLRKLAQVDQKIGTELSRESIFRFATYREVVESQGAITFYGSNGEEFQIA